MTEIEGQLVGRGKRFCIIAARFNESIVNRLIEGALDTLKRHGVVEADLQVVRVPGAFELPLAAQQVAKMGTFDGIVALGAVIRGATPHFEFVSGECSSGLNRVCLKYEIPLGFGLLTCDTVDQAVERSGTKAGNKGSEAALSTIEMVSLLQRLHD